MKTELEKKDKQEYTFKVDLKNDIVFKAVFGKESSKLILRDLINAVLKDSGFKPIKEIALKNPVILGDTTWMKTPELDILVTGEDGKQYNVEMQIEPKPNFSNRSLYYWAKTYAAQMQRGDYYENLKPVVCINFIDFMIDKKSPCFHRVFEVLEKDKQRTALSEDLRIHFIEMPTVEAEKGMLATWVRFLKEATEDSTEESMKYLFKSNPVTKDAYGVYQDSLKGQEEYLREISREKWYRDNIGRYEYEKKLAIQEGLKEGLSQGIAEGLEKGIKQGIEQGFVQGIEKGAREAKFEIAKVLFSTGDSLEKIQQVTGLSEEEIKLINK